MSKKIIQASKAPKAIGTYSQAVQKGNIVFLSGQIPLNPETMDLVEGIEQQIHQVFKNLLEVIKASDSSTDDLVKLNIYLIDLSNFALVNDIMSQYFSEPYPARAAIGVASLPKGAQVEADGFLVKGD
jgi:reactive intermediate/imine deaminase